MQQTFVAARNGQCSLRLTAVDGERSWRESRGHSQTMPGVVNKSSTNNKASSLLSISAYLVKIRIWGEKPRIFLNVLAFPRPTPLK